MARNSLFPLRFRQNRSGLRASTRDILLRPLVICWRNGGRYQSRMPLRRRIVIFQIFDPRSRRNVRFRQGRHRNRRNLRNLQRVEVADTLGQVFVELESQRVERFGRALERPCRKLGEDVVIRR